VVDLTNKILTKGNAFLQNARACALCGNKGGLKRECGWEKCRLVFHATCARQAGFSVSPGMLGEKTFNVGCMAHSDPEVNLRARIEDLLDVEACRVSSDTSSEGVPLTHDDCSKMLAASIQIMQILGWAWRWEEWWETDYYRWEPFLPHLKEGESEDDYSDEEKRIIPHNTKRRRQADSKKCQLKELAAALRNRNYDTPDGFDVVSLRRALRTLLETDTVVGPLKDFEKDFLLEWMERAYKSKSRNLGFGDDKVEIGNNSAKFCFDFTGKQKSPKFELGNRPLPGKMEGCSGDREGILYQRRNGKRKARGEAPASRKSLAVGENKPPSSKRMSSRLSPPGAVLDSKEESGAMAEMDSSRTSKPMAVVPSKENKKPVVATDLACQSPSANPDAMIERNKATAQVELEPAAAAIDAMDEENNQTSDSAHCSQPALTDDAREVESGEVSHSPSPGAPEAHGNMEQNVQPRSFTLSPQAVAEPVSFPNAPDGNSRNAVESNPVSASVHEVHDVDEHQVQQTSPQKKRTRTAKESEIEKSDVVVVTSGSKHDSAIECCPGATGKEAPLAQQTTIVTNELSTKDVASNEEHRQPIYGHATETSKTCEDVDMLAIARSSSESPPGDGQSGRQCDAKNKADSMKEQSTIQDKVNANADCTAEEGSSDTETEAFSPLNQKVAMPGVRCNKLVQPKGKRSKSKNRRIAISKERKLPVKKAKNQEDHCPEDKKVKSHHNEAEEGEILTVHLQAVASTDVGDVKIGDVAVDQNVASPRRSPRFATQQFDLTNKEEDLKASKKRPCQGNNDDGEPASKKQQITAKNEVNVEDMEQETRKINASVERQTVSTIDATGFEVEREIAPQEVQVPVEQHSMAKEQGTKKGEPSPEENDAEQREHEADDEDAEDDSNEDNDEEKDKGSDVSHVTKHTFRTRRQASLPECTAIKETAKKCASPFRDGFRTVPKTTPLAGQMSVGQMPVADRKKSPVPFKPRLRAPPERVPTKSQKKISERWGIKGSSVDPNDMIEAEGENDDADYADDGTFVGRNLNVERDRDDVSVLTTFTVFRDTSPGQKSEGNDSGYKWRHSAMDPNDPRKLHLAIDECKRNPFKVPRDIGIQSDCGFDSAFHIPQLSYKPTTRFGFNLAAKLISKSKKSMPETGTGPCILCCKLCPTAVSGHQRCGEKTSKGCTACYMMAFEKHFGVKIDRNHIPKHFQGKMVYLCHEETDCEGLTCFQKWHDLRDVPPRQELCKEAEENV